MKIQLCFRSQCTACKYEPSATLLTPWYKPCLTWKKDLSCHYYQKPYTPIQTPKIYKVIQIQDELNSQTVTSKDFYQAKPNIFSQQLSNFSCSNIPQKENENYLFTKQQRPQSHQCFSKKEETQLSFQEAVKVSAQQYLLKKQQTQNLKNSLTISTKPQVQQSNMTTVSTMNGSSVSNKKIEMQEQKYKAIKLQYKLQFIHTKLNDMMQHVNILNYKLEQL